MSQYREVVLGADIMFINRIPFFMTISQCIKFGTDKMLKNQQNKTILMAIKQVKSLYMQRGFQNTLNTVSNDEHIPEIECHIRTVKECVWCVYNTLPFC